MGWFLLEIFILYRYTPMAKTISLQSESNRIYDGVQNLIIDGDSTYYYFKSVAGYP
jgi:hypothetical protein